MPRPNATTIATRADDPDAWLVCLGKTRSVRGGTVACPLAGSVELATCRTCHLLEAMQHEWRVPDCAVGEEGR